MYKYAKDGISILTILDKRRAKKDDTYPVKIQIVYKRKQKYYPTGKDLSPENWKKLPDTRSKILRSIRKDIQHSFDKIKELVRELEFEGGFSFDALNSKLNIHRIDTLNSFFKNKINILEENTQIGTYKYYRDALVSIEKFNGNNILIASVTPEWLRKYENFMLRKKLSYTTISMYCRAIRTMINEAIQSNIIRESQYPFGKGKYEIPYSESRKMALNLQQIKQIITFTDGNEATERYRDLWFFSYLCNGINFTDMLHLKYSNIRNGEIEFMRAKTLRTSRKKKTLYATITPEMQKIIDRWGNRSKKPNSYIFPYLKGKKTPLEKNDTIKEIIRRCNKKLKIIGKVLDIGHITTYTARHSFATVLKRSGVNIAYISESLGHNDLKTTENYLASFEKEEREKNARLLTDF